jgi:hypothetical protein
LSEYQRVVREERRWDIQGAFLLTRTPLEIYKGPILFNMHERPSEHIKNRYGDIGSPCLIPRVGLKLSEKIPCTLTEKETDEIRFITSEHQEYGNPSACMTAIR